MDVDPKAIPPVAGPAQAALEDLVYRSSLAQGNRGMGGASPWVSLPVTLVLAGVFGGVVVLLAKGSGPEPKAPPSVAVVLQEGPEATPAPARPGGPVGITPQPKPEAPAPAPAPEPPRNLQAAPIPVPAPETAPEATPRELPKTDQSRLYGSAGSGTGTGTGPGGTGGGGGGTQEAGSGGGLGQVVDLDISQVREKYRPPVPPYPPLAKMARIQGNVLVQLLVGPDGVPISARAVQGPYQLRAFAESYAMTWKFEPFRRGGVPMASRFTINYSFKMD
jgi:protein TonB